MKNSSYKKRLERDLPQWISQGWIAESDRVKILNSVELRGTGDGRGWLAMAGTVLAGLAVIAFIGDNWASFPRGLKLLLLSAVFAASTLAAALTYENSRKISNGLSLLACLIFAGSVALIGQAYNLPGEPIGAAFISALAASFIGLSGRSPAASFAALVFGGIVIFMHFDEEPVGWLSSWFWGLNFVTMIVALNAFFLKSRTLWHALLITGIVLSSIHILQLSSLITGNGIEWWDSGIDRDDGRAMMFVIFTANAALWGGLAGLGVWRDSRGLPGGRTLAGYGSWTALAAIALLGIPFDPDGSVLHRILWLAAGSYTLWFGAKYRYGWIAAAAVLSLVTTISLIFFDLGMNLSSAALIFALASIVSLIVVVLLKRSADRKLAESDHA